jgi:hypothetical protein
LHKKPLNNGEWKIENGELIGMRAFPRGFHDCDQKLDKFFVVKADGCKALVSDVFGLMQQFQPVRVSPASLSAMFIL